MSRTRRGTFIVVVVTSTIGLVVALADGAPDPGVAVRAYAAAIGCLTVLSAISWLRRCGRAWSGAGAAGTARAPKIDATEPATADWQQLERALRFGATTIGDYHLLVQPRLTAIATRRLARHGRSLADAEAAEALLGKAFYLVDPRIQYPADRQAEGIPVAEIEPLLDILEEL